MDQHAIQLLHPAVADAIAAGEVVERPASVVKELIENAVDAAASRISITIVDGGLTTIEVADNGQGIAKEELNLAIERHATSKITNVEDLQHLHSHGFRGEALASIAAIADVMLYSRTALMDHGCRLHVQGGTNLGQERVGGAMGTTVTVSELFAATPARLKFLKSTRAEQSAIAKTVGDCILASPVPAMSLTIDGKRFLSTPGGTLDDAVRAVFGVRASQQLIPIFQTTGDIEVRGYISEPTVHKGTRGGLICIVNGRRIQNPLMLRAIEEAYRGFLPGKRYPFGVVCVSLPSDQVDVNVHPAKREVRFCDDRLVFQAVEHACWETVQRGGVVVVGSDDTAPPMKIMHPTKSVTPINVLHDALLALPQHEQPIATGVPVPHDQLQLFAPQRHGLLRNGSESGTPVPGTLSAIAPLRALGQIGSTWLIADSPAGTVIVDPHAAHEKVLYESIRAKFRRGVVPEQQRLLVPVVVECTVNERLTIEEHEQYLAQVGLTVEAFGPTTIRCLAIPSHGTTKRITSLIMAVLDMLEHPASTKLDQDHAAAALIACHTAVRLGDRLDVIEQQQLLDELVAQPSALTCPHGRPTTIILDDAYLRNQFRRPVGARSLR